MGFGLSLIGFFVVLVLVILGSIKAYEIISGKPKKKKDDQ